MGTDSMTVKPLIYSLDDDISMNEVMAARFKKFGCEIHTFTNATEAMDAIHARKPQLLVLDLDLGAGLTGLDLIETIRRDLQCTFPIIVVSAESSSAKVAHALEIGATDYVVKPPFRYKFEEKVAEYIEAERLAVHTPLSLRSVREESRGLRVNFPTSISEVNPMGFTLLSPYLIRKGTLFVLSGESIRDVLPSRNHVKVSVLGSATRATTEGRIYEIRVEVDSSDAAVIKEIRAFVTKMKRPDG